MIVNNKVTPTDPILIQSYILLNTTRGEVPLFRDFGLDGRMIDKPLTVIENGIFSEIQSQMNKYIPDLKLIKVDCNMKENGLEIVCEVSNNE